LTTTLYLIRHAEAEGKVYRRAHGQYNSLLTPNGHKQLEKLGQWAETSGIQAVYASDLYRARRTAQAVAEPLGLDVRPDPGLREISLGIWEDRPWGYVARTDGETLRRFNTNRATLIQGGESEPHALARFRASVDRIVQAHPGQSVAAVAHGCVIKYFLDVFAREPIPHLDNASISCLDYDPENGYTIRFCGANKYLGDLSTFSKQTWWRVTGNRDVELWFHPVDFDREQDDVLACGRACWMSVYNTVKEFDPDFFLKSCREAAQACPRYLQFAMDGDKRVGFFHMRSGQELSAWDGHIGLLYLDEKHRCRGLGVQLAGEAVRIARGEGKTGLTLRVFHKNHAAIQFYHKLGFVETDRENGIFGELLQMRRGIAVPD